MARRRASNDTGDVHPGLFADVHWGRLSLWLVAGVMLMTGTLFAWSLTEEFLIRDERFRIAEAEDIVGQSPNLKVEGVHYASASQVRHVFSQDIGRSLFLVPLQARLEELLEIDWVQDASVSKIWPNTLRVEIREREPVAFVRLPLPRGKEGSSTLALIDRYGHVLRPRIAAKFTLPVISGVRESETIESRRARVLRTLELLNAVGPLGAQISEIDVTDPNNLVVAEHVGSDVVNLMLGEENYAERLRNFLANYSEIKEKRPDAKTLDLRVDGVITAVGGKRFEQ